MPIFVGLVPVSATLGQGERGRIEAEKKMSFLERNGPNPDFHRHGV